jgi:hypothetical protein
VMITIALIVFSAVLRLDKLDRDVSRFSRMTITNHLKVKHATL